MHAVTKCKKMAFEMKYSLVKTSHDKNCVLNFLISKYVELLQVPFTESDILCYVKFKLKKI
jgi:hypothetical protein